MAIVVNPEEHHSLLSNSNHNEPADHTSGTPPPTTPHLRDHTILTYSILYRTEAARYTHYYAEQTDDYYQRDASACCWYGKGAQQLGLTGTVEPKQFQSLLRGDFGPHARTGHSVRKDSRARAGIDLTFSAPKSITLQALVGHDTRLIQAHETAVADTLAYIEQHLTQARQKDRGKTRVENTHNLIVATFRHETARPPLNAAPDPNLHTHAIIMNATQRRDGRWVALSNELIVKLRKLQDAVYMAALDRQVRALGFTIRYERNHFELAHISTTQIRMFSKRSAALSTALKTRGLNRQTASHAQRQMLTLATRQHKTRHMSRAALQSDWQQQAHAIGLNLTPTTALQKPASAPAPPWLAQATLDWAIRHLSERETLMIESDLLTTALRHAAGHLSPAELQRALQRRLDDGVLISQTPQYRPARDRQVAALSRTHWADLLVTQHGYQTPQALAAVDRAIAEGRLLFDEPRYASRIALHAEQRIVQAEYHGRNTLQPLLTEAALQTSLSDRGLSTGQRQAVALILNHPNQITGIQGMAGTGKSYALQTAQKLLIEQGRQMYALAPYGSQVNNLRADGIPARTVASFLRALTRQSAKQLLSPDTILVIDEAGVMPVQQMDQLLALVQATGARIVMLGDTAQTQAVEAGRAFALLQEQGMSTVLMNNIQRQQDPRLREAVRLAATGHSQASLRLLDQVTCIPDTMSTDAHGQRSRCGQARYESIAQAYAALTTNDQSRTLIVTGTHESRQAINTRVRTHLGLSDQGQTCHLLQRHDLTRAQRGCAKYYSVGDLIQPERDFSNGLRCGRLYRVLARHENRDILDVVDHNSTNPATRIEIKLRSQSKLSVYRTHDAELSIGDWVRVTRNDPQRQLINGQRLQVVALSATDITLQAELRQLRWPADQPLHLDYAYATTAHSAQGLTCDRVLYNAESYSRTTAQDTYYVSISRERYSITVFTDDHQQLPHSIARVNTKGLAMDLVSELQPISIELDTSHLSAQLSCER